MPDSKAQMDGVLDDLFNIVPLLHRTILRPEGLTHNPLSSDFKVMGMLMRHGPLPMSKIGTWLGIAKPNMTAIIDKLIAEDRVERRRDPEDRRVVVVSLSASGKEYMDACWREARESVKTKLSTLPEDERDTLYDSLENIRMILAKLSEMNTK